MSFLNRIGKFAKTPQGKKLMKQAQDLAKDPKTKQKIEDARERLTHRDDAKKAPQKPPAAP
jgi:hypothetical protein